MEKGEIICVEGRTFSYRFSYQRVIYSFQNSGSEKGIIIRSHVMVIYKNGVACAKLCIKLV